MNDARKAIALKEYMKGWLEGISDIPLTLHCRDYHPERLKGWHDSKADCKRVRQHAHDRIYKEGD